MRGLPGFDDRLEIRELRIAREIGFFGLDSLWIGRLKRAGKGIRKVYFVGRSYK